MSEFEKYEAMRLAGRTAAQVYEVAKQEGVDSIARIRLIRAVFGLDLVEAQGGFLSSRQRKDTQRESAGARRGAGSCVERGIAIARVVVQRSFGSSPANESVKADG